MQVLLGDINNDGGSEPWGNTGHAFFLASYAKKHAYRCFKKPEPSFVFYELFRI